jgi:hypothetical protein
MRALGGLTPRGYIHAAIYSERKAIPQVTEQSVRPDGTLGPNRVVQSKEHVTRDIEADLVLDARTARELAQWLIQKADEMDSVARELAKK